ncbi:MAG: transpeptidase family protein [Deltaproteobacteria bacterium]|nr:transpeptidase family protein [Deltaproteobacteria bacterium]
MRANVKIKGIKIRIAILMGIILLISILVVHRASGLQIKEMRKYSDLASSQHEKVIELTPKRGIILDRNGVELAITVERYSLFVRPQKFVNEGEKRLFASILADMLKRPERELLKLFNDDRPFVWVQRLLDDSVALRIRGANGFSEKEFGKKSDLKKLILKIVDKVDIKGHIDYSVNFLNSILNDRYLYRKFNIDKKLYSNMTQIGQTLLREVKSFGQREYGELTNYEKEQVRALNRYLIELFFPDSAPKNQFFYTNAFGLIKENKRVYPQRHLASHVIGFTNIDQEGAGGVELQFNESLKGEYQYISGIKDALGNEIYIGENVQAKMAEGNRVILTIDANIQYIVETELEQAVKKYNATAGYAVVINPKTGDVLAMANYPFFDGNDYNKYLPNVRVNNTISSPFEPGSVMKVFTVAAALEENIVNKDTTFDCQNGEMKIGSRTIGDAHPHGILSVEDIIKFSSNIGVAKIGLKLGGDRLLAYLKRFGFGLPTGISLPAESRGILPNFQKWPDITVATVSFGQTVAATPLQVAVAFATIANKGIYISPRIVMSIVDSRTNLTIKEFQPHRRERVISAKTAIKLIEMMRRVVEPGGTGTRASVEGFSVAGKTGTAQKVDSVTKGYSDKRIGTFVGFVPAEDAELVILVSIDEPQQEVYGGIVAAPAFSAIATKVLKYLGVFSSPYNGARNERRKSEASEDSLEADIIDVPGHQGRYYYEDEVPDLVGLPLRDALSYLRPKDMNVIIVGSGRVYRQVPPPFSSIPKDRKIVIYLKRETE